MDAIRCDASPSERATNGIILTTSQRVLYACTHHARDWTQALEAMGGEFETFEVNQAANA